MWLSLFLSDKTVYVSQDGTIVILFQQEQSFSKTNYYGESAFFYFFNSFNYI